MYENAFPANAPGAVDLRSDTVTRPSPEMYAAIAAAPLGDDVLGDEPTVQKLEQIAAEMVGMEQAMFVPSGTMANQIALACHCTPGDAILIDEDAHILYYEVGASALIAGVVSWTLPSHKAIMDPAVIEKHILKRNLHTPGTTLLCLENTHNRGGGAIIPLESMRAYRSLADKHEIKVHLDGARVFNAAVGLGRPVKDIASCVDSVSVCLSKGLRSPVGSVLCGKSDFIDKARFWRKRLGGGMRQAGILAACGIVSLTQMVDRLAEDHARAKRIATSIGDLTGLSVDLSGVQTNMVLVDTVLPATEWQETMAKEDIHFLPVGANRFRMVLHADIDDAKLDKAIGAFTKVAEASSAVRA